ncbi:MAG: hypothetical protein WA151_19190 [Desulfatirhabdiaceae bacterium]
MTENFSINIEKEAAEFKGEFKVLPPGWRKVVILTGKMEDTKDKTGEMLVLTYECPEGGVTDRLNLFNPSEIAQKIGRQALAKICESAGLTGNFILKDIPKLFGRYIDVELGIEEFKSNKADANGHFKKLSSNKCKNYAKAGTKSVSNPAPAAMPESEATEQSSTVPEQKKMPW